ncbi:DUF4105 domain-containing protein [Bacteroides pyogenes]|uniref:Uncharacterized protein n=2 Tax=Bacteroides pyogenes TaxID=310300 RepID=W4PN18_9BACE|nr:DUF4105 domain-containing protein [Bacteroides pyogenes]GAE20499.1 hypothetical protein JCM6294_3713 [Bacteroides pyogenes DSM 20611 = JCM 6294]
MKRYIPCLLLALLILYFPAEKASASQNDSVHISLLTCSPGEEIYTLFGHTAIRYQNLSRNIDVVFNYGLFSFNAPNFIFRFALGETDYQLGVTEFDFFAGEYAYYGRSVWQQELNLAPKEKERLLFLLERNYLPENRVYRYNYFYDNCCTRPRDRIEECVMDGILYPSYPKDGSRTYRKIIHEFCKDHPWARFGMDFCLGSAADRPINRRQMMFAPYYLMNAFAGAHVGNEIKRRPLVTSTKEIIQAKTSTDAGVWFPTPFQSSLLLFILAVAFTIYGIRKGKGLWGIDLLLFGAAGIAGCILAFLAIFSQHPALNPNFLLIAFHPLHLLLLPYIIYCVRKRKKCAYHTLNFLVLMFFIILFPLIPQNIDFAVVPLALSLLIRSASNMILTYTKKE